MLYTIVHDALALLALVVISLSFLMPLYDWLSLQKENLRETMQRWLGGRK